MPWGWGAHTKYQKDYIPTSHIHLRPDHPTWQKTKDYKGERLPSNMNKTTTITKLERQLLCDLAQSDHSSDGHGFTMWVGVGYESLPMRQVRALITTLREKGIIHYSPPYPQYDEPAHIGPCAEFVEGGERKTGQRKDGSTWVNIEPDHERFGGRWNSDPFTDGIHGYRYKNLKVI